MSIPRAIPLFLVLVLIGAACGSGDSATASSSSTTTSSTAPGVPAGDTTDGSIQPSSTTSTTSTTSAPSTTSTTTTTPPVARSDEWKNLDVSPDIFGPLTITDGAVDGGRLVLAGCHRGEGGPFPVWWSDNMTDWTPATGPTEVGCLTQVEASPFGFYASGFDGFHSEDGVGWERLELADEFGFEYSNQLGVVFAVFVAPENDRVTLLYSRASEAETRIATLVTTTDGVTWQMGPAESAALFDSSDVAAVIAGGDGLLAVGSSPGGEFVPTAAVFTSTDGLSWRRVTPPSVNFNDKIMTDIANADGGFVAVGGDFFRSGLMAAWTSLDGITWALATPPSEEIDPSVAYMTAEAVTTAGTSLWASGIDFDARRDDRGIAALWSSEDGTTWTRALLEELGEPIPFFVIDDDDLQLGTWPPPHSTYPGVVQLFVAS